MTRQYLLGLDVGSSSVKAALVDIDTRQSVASAYYPKDEASIDAPQKGWAEQDPRMWWENAKRCISTVMSMVSAGGEDVKAVGISYQMHGLVCVDKNRHVVRPSIIWCDSRAVPYGEQAFRIIGENHCLTHYLNSPGNFTAAKLAWVKSNEPDNFRRTWKFMLPGDYIAMRFSGEVNTTIGGLSEGILWDFKEKHIANALLDYFGIPREMVADIAPTFGIQCLVSREAAEATGLKEGTPVSYRAGDQPNNALSLNVFNPGEIASTAGTSGVVYGVLGSVGYDPESRVNTFAHVNYTTQRDRLGVLLCINSTGILNAWMHRNVAPTAAGGLKPISYKEMDELAALAPIGSDGLTVIPFGNGAERMLGNKEPGCSFHGIDFNKHSRAHLLRATQEGIVFSFCYGMDVMRQIGMPITTIHAGRANMFQSPLFCDTLATVSDANIRLYATDGSMGAALGAGMGCGLYADNNEAFDHLRELGEVYPDHCRRDQYLQAYEHWKTVLRPIMESSQTDAC